jgi:NB-ARC domain
MSDPLTGAVASKVADSIVASVASRMREAIFGNDERRALDQAVSRALRILAEEIPGFADAASSLPIDLYFGHSAVAAMLADGAFANVEPDRDKIIIQLAALGYDETTSPIDLAAAAVDFSHRLRSEIRRDADRSGSALFNRFALAQLDRVADSLQAHARSRSAMLPYLAPLILGRDRDIEVVSGRLIQAASFGSGAVTVIRGWPGVGKSTLAAAIAHDRAVWDSFPDGVLWTALGEMGNARATLALWCRQLGAAAAAESNGVNALSAQLAGLLRGKRILLIVDDVWQAEQATPLLVGGRGTAALLTTRSTEEAYRLASVPDDIYVLEVLTEADGLALLRTLAPSVVEEYPGPAAELVAEVEALPLALQVAGRLLAAEAYLGLGVSDLLADLREGSRLLSAQAPADRADLVTATTPTVAALLAQSTNRLPATLREQFAYLGAFAEKPATFNIEAITAVWDVAEPLRGIRTLVGRGLLEPTGDGRFQMHALLAMHAQALLAEL